MTQVATENILVVPTSKFHEIGHFQGFCRDVDKYVSGLLHGADVSFRPRDEMEEDPRSQAVHSIRHLSAHDRGRNGAGLSIPAGQGAGENSGSIRCGASALGATFLTRMPVSPLGAAFMTRASAGSWRKKSSSIRPTPSRASA